MTPKPPLVVPSTTRRDALVGGTIGLLVLAFVVFGVVKMSQPVQGNKLTGTIIEKEFIPMKEQVISFSGRKIEGVKESDGEYLFKVRVEGRPEPYEVPVEKVMYEAKKVGDSMTFLRPPSEQR